MMGLECGEDQRALINLACLSELGKRYYMFLGSVELLDYSVPKGD